LNKPTQATLQSPLREKILGAVLAFPNPAKFSVEFGAWDGLHLLNCRNLIQEHGHGAVLIEADSAKFERLRKNYGGVSRVECLQAMVGWGKADSLDAILRTTGCPARFDFLSIDVDGNDYHIWKAVSSYQPAVVCVEFNPTIPKEVEFVNPADPKIQQGSSLKSLCKLAEEKGYGILHVDFHDVLFGSLDYFQQTGISPIAWQAIKMDTSAQTQLFVGYDGRILIRGAATLRWNGLRFYEQDLQILPGWLQRLPDSMNPFQKACLVLIRIFRRWRGSWRRRLGFPLKP
jgi:hypothetical protein